ncbi:MAG: DUF423 domain-containing protein [Bacilli bacterium]|jgi:uncharacterized membrane protein YgdD (TMEM256/DUF423 family)|uniref:DUF423 domain-containing protein n=1 Tax=Ureibacillus suwonensis TaxID=313007 RepID=A0ABW0R9G0_9BACL|nr:DUF423 domain-containing protein [Bacilli bacterium]
MKGSIITGAVFGFLAVALGAFGAHALKGVLDAYGESIWDTAVQYQMFHAAGIILVGILMHPRLIGDTSPLKWSFLAMTFGILFFSGSLYVLAVSGISVLGAITPIGGVLFLIGWTLVIVGVAKSRIY